MDGWGRRDASKPKEGFFGRYRNGFVYLLVIFNIFWNSRTVYGTAVELTLFVTEDYLNIMFQATVTIVFIFQRYSVLQGRINVQTRD